MGSRNRSNRKDLPKYIYDIPYGIRRKLCMALDADGDWHKLVGEFQNIHPDEVKMFERELQRPGGSPTDLTLTKLGNYCTTVVELFRVLHDRGLHRQRDLLQTVVPKDVFKKALDGEQWETSESINKPRLETDELSEFPSLSNMEPRKHPVQSEYSETRTNTSSELPSPRLPPESSADISKRTGKTQTEHSHSSVGQKETHRVTNLQNEPVELQETSSTSDNCQSESLEVVLFPYSDLATGTANFNSKLVIGKGGFGEVYYATYGPTPIAIKRLRKKTPNDDRDVNSMMKEISALTKYPHPNIVKLIGCSKDGPEPCLVYEYMRNGSLEDRLICKNHSRPLIWQVRQTILIGAAEGLNYLHTTTQKPLIHGDIKSANILLDEHFNPKLADFGLAVQATGGSRTNKFTHKTHNSNTYFGSIGYLPDELFGNGMRYNIRTDVFSFGIVIFECCTALKALDERRGDATRKLKDYIESFSDHDLGKLKDELVPEWRHDCWNLLMRLGTICSHDKKRDRPEMAQVLEELKRIHLLSTTDMTQTRDPPSVNTVMTPSPSVMSHHLSHYSEAPGKSLQAPPSPATPLQKSQPGFKKFESITEASSHSLEYNRSKLEEMEAVGNMADKEPPKQSAGIHSQTIDLKSDPHDQHYVGEMEVDNAGIKRQLESVPMLLQKHYDALSAKPESGGSECLVLKRGDREDSCHRGQSVEAVDDSDDGDDDLVYSNAGLIPPNRHKRREEVGTVRPGGEPYYGNTRPEDHQVELITDGMHGATIQCCNPGIPHPAGHREISTTGHIYQNVPLHLTEHQDNRVNEHRAQAGGEPLGHVPRGYIDGKGSSGKNPSLQTIGRRSTPDETSDPEDTEDIYEEVTRQPESGDDVIVQKSLPSFFDDDVSSAGSSQWNFGFEKNSYCGLVKNPESGLYEVDSDYARHQGSRYLGTCYTEPQPDGDGKQGEEEYPAMEEVLGQSPRTPTHSPGAATPSSPPIYTFSGGS